MVRIGLVGDIHMEAGNRGAVQDMLDRVVAGFRDADVDMAVVMGDLVTYSETADEDRAFIRDIMDRVETLDVPVRTLLGNHEVVNLSRPQVCGLLGQEPYGAVTVGGQDVIVLDSSAPHLSGSRGELGARQRDWLAETLPAVEDALVFSHHPLHYHNVEDSPWWDDYPERAFCGDKKEVRELFTESPNVRTVVNAHLHAHDRTITDGIPHVTIDPFARKTPDSGVDGAYAILDTGEGEIVLRTPDTEITTYDI